MIIDNQSNLLAYSRLNKNINVVADFISTIKLESITDAKTIIEKNETFVLKFNYLTREESDCLWEAHRTYLDLHLVIEGNERIFFNDKTKMEIENEYDIENDYQLFKGSGQEFILKPGNFLLFQPQDVHRTGVIVKEQEPVQKMVFKLKI